jgi:hypothetical protein
MDENSSVLPLSDASMERGPGGEVYFQRRGTDDPKDPIWYIQL